MSETSQAEQKFEPSLIVLTDILSAEPEMPISDERSVDCAVLWRLYSTARDAAEVAHPALKARLADLAWVNTKQHEAARLAIDGYIECDGRLLAGKAERRSRRNEASAPRALRRFLLSADQIVQRHEKTSIVFRLTDEPFAIRKRWCFRLSNREPTKVCVELIDCTPARGDIVFVSRADEKFENQIMFRCRYAQADALTG